MRPLTKTLLPLATLLLPAAGQAAESALYAFTPLKLAPLSSYINVTGRVVPQDGALNIESARVQGRIVAILAKEGDHVTKGSPLFEINSAECTTMTEERRVANKNKATELLEGVKRREEQLGLKVTDQSCKQVATYSGTITKRNLESGVSFNIGDAMVTVLDTKRLSVELDLPERDVSGVREGQKVVYRLAANPDKSFSSTVRSVVPAIDSTSRTARVRLTTPALPSNASLDGLVFGQIENRSSESVFTVPSSALVFSKNARYVVRGPQRNAIPIEVDVMGEANESASIRPHKKGELKEDDVIATDRVIYLYRKLTEGMGPS